VKVAVHADNQTIFENCPFDVCGSSPNIKHVKTSFGILAFRKMFFYYIFIFKLKAFKIHVTNLSKKQKNVKKKLDKMNIAW
jgi:hypothetical protein